MVSLGRMLQNICICSFLLTGGKQNTLQMDMLVRTLSVQFILSLGCWDMLWKCVFISSLQQGFVTKVSKRCAILWCILRMYIQITLLYIFTVLRLLLSRQLVSFQDRVFITNLQVMADSCIYSNKVCKFYLCFFLECECSVCSMLSLSFHM